MRAADSAEQLVQRSQAVATCTPTRTPYLQPAWIHAGLHLACMGADLPEKPKRWAWEPKLHFRVYVGGRNAFRVNSRKSVVA